jgi:hypothetical protein
MTIHPGGHSDHPHNTAQSASHERAFAAMVRMAAR